MSIFACGLEISTRYKVPTQSELPYGEIMSVGHLARVLHILRIAREKHGREIQVFDYSNMPVSEIFFWKLMNCGYEIAKKNRNTSALKEFFGYYSMMGMSFSVKYIIKDADDYIQEEMDSLLSNLEQEKATRVFANVWPAVLRIANFLTLVGKHQEAISFLRRDDVPIFLVPTVDETEILKLLITNCLLQAADSGSSEPLKLLLSTPAYRQKFTQNGSLAAAIGIYHMMNFELKEAIEAFSLACVANAEIVEGIVSTGDIEAYLILVCMACSDNEEMFRTFDNFESSRWLRNAYYLFYENRFSEAFDNLEKIYDLIPYDPFLTKVGFKILNVIIDRALIKTCNTFTQVKLSTLGRLVKISVSDVRNRLETLILESKLRGCVNKVEELFEGEYDIYVEKLGE